MFNNVFIYDFMLFYNDYKFRFKEWDKEMIDPIFLDLGSGKEYNKLNPDRWYNTSSKKQ